MDVIERETVQQDTDTMTAVLVVTPTATQIIRNLLQQRNIPDHALRVFVSGGGCSGLQYGMAFESQVSEHDQVVSVDGIRLVVDPTSLMYLQGATIDYVDSLMGGGFRIDNPNAASSCGCGHSFRTGQNAGDESSGGCASCSH